MKRIAILISLLVLTLIIERSHALEQATPTELADPMALNIEKNRGSCAGVDCRNCCSENNFMVNTSQCCRCCSDCALRFGNFQCDDWPI